MQSAEQIIADIQELEKFHLSEEKMLNERCQVLADLYDKAKRELEAGAEAAQICGEIGEMIGREATREKSSRVGNAAKMRDALDKIYNKLETLDVEEGSYADEIIASVKSDIVHALSAPPRNCDRPECATTREAQEVWRKEDGGKTAYYEWLLSASTKGETKWR